MKMYINSASPYARRARIAALERNLGEIIEFIEINPWEDPEDLHAETPIGRLPALITDTGEPVVESLVIMQQLNRLGSGPDLGGEDEIAALRRAGLAQGIIDSSYFSVIEGRRPNDKQWPALVTRQNKVIERTLAAVAPSRDGFDYGDITLVSALGYLSFRLPDVPWRTMRPDLASWMDEAAQRPSVETTRPDK